MTPDQLKSLFDGNAMLVIFVVNLLYTRLPVLAKFSNQAAPWIGAVVYVLMKYILPQPAEAAGFGHNVGVVGGFLWTTALGAWTSALTSLFYDKYLKTILDKAIPKPA